MRFVRARLTADIAGDTDWVADQAGFVSGYKIKSGSPGLKLVCYYKFTDSAGDEISQGGGSATIKPVFKGKAMLNDKIDDFFATDDLTGGVPLTGVAAFQRFIISDIMTHEEIGFQYSSVASAPPGGVKLAFYVKELR